MSNIVPKPEKTRYEPETMPEVFAGPETVTTVEIDWYAMTKYAFYMSHSP